MCTVSGCNNDSGHLCSDQSSTVSSPTNSDQLSSTSTYSSVNSSSSYCGRTSRRHSLPPLRGNHAANSRQLSKSTSNVLWKRRAENRSSDSTSSVSNSLNDSGCNSSGTDTLLDQTESRSHPHRGWGAEAAMNDDTRQTRDDAANDSGYHNTTVQPDAASVRGSNSESETRDEDGSKEPVEVRGLNISASNLHAAESANSDGEMLSPMPVVLRRTTSSPAKCQQNCAADGDRVVTRKLRRSSLMARQLQQPDKVAKTRRRHSFMLPNGSDIYPTQFGVGFTWPTIVEEDSQLTGAMSDENSARQFPKKCVETVFGAAKDNPFADLMEFRATLKNGRQSANVESGKLYAAPSSDENGFPIKDGSSADCRALGAKLRSDLQLAHAESEQMNSELSPNDCGTSDVIEEGSFADLKALGVELGKASSAAEAAASPSPPLTHNPPSYDEALLHKALRRSDLVEAQRLLTYQALTDSHGPAAGADQLTSSTYGDVTVTSGMGAGESSAVYRRPPPPPYQLRPRRQNNGEQEIHDPLNSRPIQRTSVVESATGRDVDGSEGQQWRKNKSEPAVVRVIDRNSPDLRRSSSFPSPNRRRRPNSAQKENVGAAASTLPRSASNVTPNACTAGQSSCTPAGSVDVTRRTSRNSVSLKRRSLTVKDRDWHRELVDQYSSARTSRSGSMSTTARA